MRVLKQHSLTLLLVVCFVLTACDIEGGVPPSTTPGALPPIDSTQDTSQPSPTRVSQQTGFRIGLLEEPRDLLPYHEDVADERITAPMSELLFPAPVLTHHYNYTTTSVLEQLPSFANGDIEIRDVDVYINEAGNIVSSVADVLEETQRLTMTEELTPTEEITTTDEAPVEPQVSPEILEQIGATGEITQAQQVVVTFRWNPSLRWSDGTPMTADDSVFAYELAQTMLLGNTAFERSEFLYAYEKVDEHTTRAVLQPDFLDESTITPSFTDPSYLMTYWTPLPRHILGVNTAEMLFDYAWSPVGYGPYMIDRREQGGIRFKRNPYYENDGLVEEGVLFLFLPNFEVLRTSLLGGSLDVAVAEYLDPEQFEFVERDLERNLYQAIYVPSPIWEHLDFNLDVTFLQDINMRRGIAHATNRQAMIDALLGGHVSVLDSWIVPESWATAPSDTLTRYPYNLDEANRLLDQVTMLDSNGDGIRDPIGLDMLTIASTPLRAEIARMFQADMAQVGIAVTIHELPAQQFYSSDGPLYRRQFHLAQYASISTPNPGGLSLWSCPAVPNENNGWTGNNFAGWCFRDADQAIREATTAQSREERVQAYLKQQQLFTQELPSLPLFQRLSVTLLAPDMAHVKPDPTASITWNIVEWRRDGTL